MFLKDFGHSENFNDDRQHIDYQLIIIESFKNPFNSSDAAYDYVFLAASTINEIALFQR